MKYLAYFSILDDVNSMRHEEKIIFLNEDTIGEAFANACEQAYANVKTFYAARPNSINTCFMDLRVALFNGDVVSIPFDAGNSKFVHFSEIL